MYIEPQTETMEVTAHAAILADSGSDGFIISDKPHPAQKRSNGIGLPAL